MSFKSYDLIFAVNALYVSEFDVFGIVTLADCDYFGSVLVVVADFASVFVEAAVEALGSVLAPVAAVEDFGSVFAAEAAFGSVLAVVVEAAFGSVFVVVVVVAFGSVFVVVVAAAFGSVFAVADFGSAAEGAGLSCEMIFVSNFKSSFMKSNSSLSRAYITVSTFFSSVFSSFSYLLTSLIISFYFLSATSTSTYFSATSAYFDSKSSCT